MSRFTSACAACVLGAILAAASPTSLRAQEQFQYESDLVARHHLFEDVGPGFRAIHRAVNGNYYILSAPSPAVQIFDPAGKRIGQVPNESAVKVKGAALVYGESFDLDRDGRVAVCDSGANAVKLYAPDGTLAMTISIRAPDSIAFLPAGELAVASPGTDHLVTVYDLAGKVVREYGDRDEITDRADVNSQLNFGHLAADDEGNSYFAFDFMPEPTVRKFDRVGYLTSEILLNTLEFQPAAQSARKVFSRSQAATPTLHRIISAIGVEARTEDVWLAVGTLLMHFSKDGERLASFRTYLPSGGRMEAGAILIEPDRLIIATDPQGIYEFPRLDKQR